MAITSFRIREELQDPLEQAATELMFERALAIDETLGRKEGLAVGYANLGTVYRTRGDLDQAVAMYERSLEIDEVLGRKGPSRKLHKSWNRLPGSRRF